MPFLAHYAAFLAATLFLASLAVYVRYILILTLVAASPLLAVGYLHLALRGAVRHAVSLLAGLMVAGPVAAVFMVVVNAVVPGQSITFGILYPLIVGVLPTLLGTLGGVKLEDGPVRFTWVFKGGAPGAGFEPARGFPHRLSRPAPYQARRPRQAF